MSAMMSDKMVLVSAIGLRYWELNTGDTHEQRCQSAAYTKTLLKEITPKENLVDDGVSKDNIINLGGVLEHLNLADSPQDYHMTKQVLRSSVKGDNELFDSLMIAIEDKSPNEIDKYKIACIDHIGQYFKYKEFFNDVKKFTTNILYRDKSGTNIKEAASEMIAKLAPYSTTGTSDGGVGINGPLVVAGFSTHDAGSIEKVWSKAQVKSSPESIMKTGYQGTNRLFGAPGGMFRGDTILIGALQHNYKSGTLDDWLSDICHYNKPYIYNEGKKGAVVHLSFENDAGDDLNRIYKRAYFMLHGSYPSLEDILNTSPEQVARVVDDYTSVNGFKYFYMRMNPSEIGYLDIQKTILEIESLGYEIHVLGLDYLSMISLKGITRMGDGTEYQELFRLMRNFCSERDITLITPHQLSTEATYLNRDGYESDFVTKVAGMSYWSRSKQIDREVDVEIVQHIVKVPNPQGGSTSYLTQAIGKNRRVHDTKPEHKSCALVFTEHGLIPDLGKEPNYIGDLKKLRRMGGVDMDDEF